MIITDELREWASIEVPYKYGHQLTSIADRIDAEHEKQCAESWMRGHDAWAAIDRSDEMAEHGWIRLPLDADGVPWHIGDVNENGRTITTMCLTAHGWHFSNIQNDINPSIHHHHHAPTVEDVLTKFGIDWEYESDCEDRAALLAEYAAKLRLVEGE